MKALLLSLALVLALSCPTLAEDENWNRYNFSHFSLELPRGWETRDKGEAVILTDGDIESRIIIVSREVEDDMKAEDGASLFCRSLSGSDLKKNDATTYTFEFFTEERQYTSLFTVQGKRFYWISYSNPDGQHDMTISNILSSLRYLPAAAANAAPQS